MAESTKDWFFELVSIMAQLRNPDGGCPWDLKQDHATLKKYLIEEAYELIDAIDHADDEAIKDELGDVLLQVVFHAQIASEEGRFDIDGVTQNLCEKLIRRHPHVFGDTVAEDAETVLTNWEAIKSTEKAGSKRQSVLDGVPRHLPALSQAEKIQKKAAKVGFDWPNIEGVIAKIEEELGELKEALATGTDEEIHDEIGDVLFTIANLTRYRHESAEDILRKTIAKFHRRFSVIEQEVSASGRPFEDYTLDELDAIWNKVKRSEKAQ